MQTRWAERRASERFGTHLAGRIRGVNGASPVNCIVQDLSETGARITFLDPVEVPLEFDLHIPLENATAKARLVWSNGARYGIRFLD